MRRSIKYIKDYVHSDRYKILRNRNIQIKFNIFIQGSNHNFFFIYRFYGKFCKYFSYVIFDVFLYGSIIFYLLNSMK